MQKANMRISIFIICFFIIKLALLSAQATFVITGQCQDPAVQRIGLNLPFHCYLIDQNTLWTTTTTTGRFALTVDLHEAQFAFLRLEDRWIKIYVEPDVELEVRISSEKRLSFKGRSGAVNDLLQKLNCGAQMGVLRDRWLSEKDPVQLWKKIEQSKTEDLQGLQVFAEAHPEASQWIPILRSEIDYFHRAMFYQIGERHAYFFPIDSTFDKTKWLEITDQQFSQDDLQNEAALLSIGYFSWLDYYFDWEQRRLMEPTVQMDEFEQMNYCRQLFEEDPKTLLPRMRKDQFQLLFKQMVYQKKLRGPVLEKLLAGGLYTAASFQYFETIGEAYQHFRDLFPDSRYVQILEQKLRPILDRQVQVERDTLRDKYIFLEADIEGWDSLAQVLSPFRGQVVLIDLWFSTCGPCRKEFGYLPELKNKFSDQELVYLYISTDRPSQKEQWRETAHYFKLEGKHVLGNQALLSDIWQQLPPPRYTYPRYLLVNRQGNIQLKKAPLPSEKEKLYQAINQLIREE